MKIFSISSLRPPFICLSLQVKPSIFYSALYFCEICKMDTLNGESAGKVVLQLSLWSMCKVYSFSALGPLFFFFHSARLETSRAYLRRGLWVKSCVSVFKSLFRGRPSVECISLSCWKTPKLCQSSQGHSGKFVTRISLIRLFVTRGN